MKKTIISIIISALLAACVFSLSACTQKPTEKELAAFAFYMNTCDAEGNDTDHMTECFSVGESVVIRGSLNYMYGDEYRLTHATDNPIYFSINLDGENVYDSLTGEVNFNVDGTQTVTSFDLPEGETVIPHKGNLDIASFTTNSHEYTFKKAGKYTLKAYTAFTMNKKEYRYESEEKTFYVKVNESRFTDTAISRYYLHSSHTCYNNETESYGEIKSKILTSTAAVDSLYSEIRDNVAEQNFVAAMTEENRERYLNEYMTDWVLNDYRTDGSKASTFSTNAVCIAEWAAGSGSYNYYVRALLASGKEVFAEVEFIAPDGGGTCDMVYWTLVVVSDKSVEKVSFFMK